MAYKDTFYVYGAPVTCTGSGNHDWIFADFKIVVTANSNNTAYNVQVYARIDASGRMNWDGSGDIRVTHDGKTYSQQVQLEMREPGVTTWDGPASFTLGAPGITKLTMNLDLDLTRTTGTNGGKGPTHNSDGGNMQHFYYNNYSITVGEDGGLPPLITPPSISELTNSNPYNSDLNISSSTDSINISWKESGTVTNRYYRINGGAWTSASSSNVSLVGLSSGTNYSIDVKSSNSAGDSNILNTIIRTRYTTPVVRLTFDSRTLDTIIFTWTSDKTLSVSEYRINNGEWLPSNSGSSGTITINQLTPNTLYNVSFRGTSSSTYDSLSSNTSTASGTTLDMARITSIGECIFGNDISIIVNKIDPNISKLKIWTTGNSSQPEFEMEVVNGSNTFTPTQDQLDRMYKCFTTSNSIPIYFSLSTTGTWGEWTDIQQEKTLQLTGIVKTAYANINNRPRRSQVWIEINGIPRRAIVWVDVNNKPKRCI